MESARIKAKERERKEEQVRRAKKRKGIDHRGWNTLPQPGPPNALRGEKEKNEKQKQNKKKEILGHTQEHTNFNN